MARFYPTLANILNEGNFLSQGFSLGMMQQRTLMIRLNTELGSYLIKFEKFYSIKLMTTLHFQQHYLFFYPKSNPPNKKNETIL